MWSQDLFSISFHRHYVSGKLTACIYVLTEKNASMQCGLKLVHRPCLIPVSTGSNPCSCSKGLLLALPSQRTDNINCFLAGCSELQPEKESSIPTKSTLHWFLCYSYLSLRCCSPSQAVSETPSCIQKWKRSAKTFLTQHSGSWSLSLLPAQP